MGISSLKGEIVGGIEDVPQLQDVLDTLAAGAIEILVTGNGNTIVAGVQADWMAPWSGQITGWRVVGDPSGSIVWDVWRDTYANFPPVVGDSICGAEKPTLSSAAKNEDLNLASGAGWPFSAGDWLRFNVDSATTVTRATLVLLITRT